MDFGFWIAELKRTRSKIPEARSFSGFTLIEIVVAIVLAAVVILAIGQVDVTRVRLAEEIRRREAMEPMLVLVQMAKHLQQADRIQLNSPTDVQLRVPLGTAFDVPGNYQWVQYRLVGTTLRFCTGGSLDTQFAGITALAIQYKDEAPPPPGGDPANQDNNVLEFLINNQYRDEVTIRAGAYTYLMTGLAPPAISPPPGSC